LFPDKNKKEKTSELSGTEFTQPTEGLFYNPLPVFPVVSQNQKEGEE
jgi:hypothetical protein